MSIASQLSFSTATSVRGGALGSIPYQNATSSTVFVSIGSAGTVLTSNGTAPTWAAASTIASGTASYLSSSDDRVKAPSDDSVGMRFGFTSFANNNTSPYADYLHLRSYSDSTGGNDNLVMFRKDAIGIRVWQQAWGSATAYATYKDVALEANAVSFTSLGVGTPASGVTGEFRATNEITAYDSADIRLKENIRLIADPITIVNQIRGVYYDWTDEHITARGGEDGYFVRKHDIGVIAQEVEKVLPEIVATRDDGTKVVKYEKLVALLIEAVKDQQQQINQLSDLVNTLVVK